MDAMETAHTLGTLECEVTMHGREAHTDAVLGIVSITCTTWTLAA